MTEADLLPDEWFEPGPQEWANVHRVRIIDAHARGLASEAVIRKYHLPPPRQPRRDGETP
jgi:hypothetical protein